MAKAVGVLAVNLVARTKKFQSGLNNANRMVSTFKGGIIKAGLTVVRFAKRLAAVGFAAFVAGMAVLVVANEKFTRSMTQSLAIMGNVSAMMTRILSCTIIF